MNILYLNPDRGIPVLGDKGASVHVREFVTALARQVDDIILVCATLGKGNSPPPARIIEVPPNQDMAMLEAEAVALGLPSSALDNRILRRELGRLAYDRQFCDRVLAEIRALGFRPDVIYERFALFHSAGATLAQALGVPRLLEVNAPLIQEQERFRGLHLKSAAITKQIASFDGADAVIAVSDEVADFVRATGVPSERIDMIPNGVDTTRFWPDADSETTRSELGLTNGPVVGFIGSFKPWHGVAFLIDAFATIAETDLGVQLLCVGEGPELASARHSVTERGLNERAVFTGRVPYADIPACLASMDVSVAPYLPSSDFYFSPLKVVESLAAGTPVVASRIGQLEYLIDDGWTGALFTPGSKDDFIAKTVDLLADPARRRVMSLEARKRALSDFSWSRAASRAVAKAKRLAGAARAA